MRSSRVSLRPATTHVSVSGTPASTSAWRTCHPHAVATASASGARQLGHPLAGLGQQVEHAELGQHDLVPVGAGADHTGQAANAVGQGTGAGVDEPGGELVPRGVAGQRRVGESGAQAVVEPAVELDQPATQPLDPLVAARSRSAVRRRGVVARSPSSASAGRRAPARLVRRATASRRRVPVDPRRPPAGAVAAGDMAAHPHHQQGQARACTAANGWGTSTARQRRRGRPSCRTARARSHGSDPSADALVGAERRPAGRDGERLGGGEPRRRAARWPPPARSSSVAALAHPVDCTEGVSQRPGGRSPPVSRPSVALTAFSTSRVGLNGRSCIRRPSSRRSPRSSWPSCRTRRCWRRSCCRPGSSDRCRCGSAPRSP